MKIIWIAVLIVFGSGLLFGQGLVEAEEVRAGTLRGAIKGDGSGLTGLPPQFLSISETGDTLHITEGNFVIIPGFSSCNSGTAFANAGVDILNAYKTSQ